MTHSENYQAVTGISGGRESSPLSRAADLAAENFAGLPEGTSRGDLFVLVREGGPGLGLKDNHIQLLLGYLNLTADAQWQEGERPIVYQSQATTALKHKVDERTIRRWEKHLHKHGFITIKSSGNNKRYGLRNSRTGKLVYGFGVDLSPLAARICDLEAKMHEEQMRIAAWQAEKRTITAYRGRICAYLRECGRYEDLEVFKAEMEALYAPLSKQITATMSLERLRETSKGLETLASMILVRLEQCAPSEEKTEEKDKLSARTDQNDLHTQTTSLPESPKGDTSNPNGSSSQGSVAAPSEGQTGPSEESDSSAKPEMGSTSTGLEHVSWQQVLQVASDRMVGQLPKQGRIEWIHIVDAARDLLPALKIHQSAWWEAVRILGGQNAAAVCVMIIDRKLDDPENPVRNPGGYLRAMVKKAEAGELHLHSTIFGFLEKQKGQMDA